MASLQRYDYTSPQEYVVYRSLALHVACPVNFCLLLSIAGCLVHRKRVKCLRCSRCSGRRGAWIYQNCGCLWGGTEGGGKVCVAASCRQQKFCQFVQTGQLVQLVSLNKVLTVVCYISVTIVLQVLTWQ